MTKLRLAAICAAAILFLPGVSAAQSRHDVSGVIADSSGAGLQGATVVLLAPADSALVKFAISGKDGVFSLKRVDSGSYVLQVTFVGFQTWSGNVEVGSEDLDVGRIALSERVSELDELVVTSEHIPIIIRSDTLDYNANAFATRPNAMVEDLLRQLPGVEVDSDGSIKAQGEDVQKVLVDGKEFFGNDPKIATRNLPANAVDRVQVYDDRSDRAEFTGVDDGEREKTINLELKEDAKKGYFGNVSGGIGDTERYDSRVSVNRFSGNTQFSVLGNLNNVNEQGFSVGDYISFMGGMGAFSSGGIRFGAGGGGPSIGTSLSDGFSETLAGGINFNHEFSDRTSLRSSYFINSLENEQNRTLNQEQVLGSGRSSMVNEAGNQLNDNWNHRVNVNLFHELADGHDLRLRADATSSHSILDNNRFRQTADGSDVLQNSNTSAYGSTGDQLGGNVSLTYRKRLNDNGLSLVAESRVNVRDNDTRADLESLTRFYEDGNVVSDEEILQFQETLGDQFTMQQELSLSQSFGKGFLAEVTGEHRRVGDDEERSFYDIVNGSRVLNTLLSTGSERTYSYTQGGFSLRRAREGFTTGVGVDVQRSSLEGTLRGVTNPVTQGYTHVLPSADARYNIRQGMSLNARYNTSTREPSMRELQPFADNSDPLNVYVGNPALQPEYTHRISLGYSFFDQFTFTSMFAFINASYTDNKIARSRTIDDQFRQTSTSINTDGDWSFNGNLNFSTPIRPLGVKINLSNTTMFSRGLEILNGEENATRILRNSIDTRLENRDKDIFDLSAGIRFDINRTAYSLNPNQDQAYVNKTITGRGTLYIGKAWQVASELNYRMYSKEISGTETNVPLWEASVSRFFMDERLELQLSGKDLLNRNVGVNFTNTSTFVQEERIESLGRYVMFKLIYKLSATGGPGGPGGRGIRIG